MAPNDAESATITFDTGVAQEIITFPQLFKILITALLRMLTAIGQNQGFSHGLTTFRFLLRPRRNENFARRDAGVHSMVWHGNQF